VFWYRQLFRQLAKYQSFNDPKKPLEAMSHSDQNRWLQRFAEQIVEAFAEGSDTA